MEQWTGKRFNPEEICQLFGATQAFSSNTFEKKLISFLSEKYTIFYEFENALATQKIQAIFNKMAKHAKKNSLLLGSFENLSPLVQELRLFKSEYEISLMRTAAQISVQAHKNAMRACRPGLFEYQLEAEILYTFMQQGARFAAYPSIVGAGNNACTLHYNSNSAEIKKTDLVLIDAGAEYTYYASDVTRTFPASGKFTSAQRVIYDIVLVAQQSAIASIKPGSPWNQAQEIITRIITEGLLDLGILKGNIDTLIETKAYFPFYPHNSGHWLGLDTHDPSTYQYNKNWRLLEPGMVLTVEPGIYIPENCESVDPRWRGIGVRIEDDVLVTEVKHEILSQGLPKEVEEIEGLVGERSSPQRASDAMGI
jgi:Xaa-Pro aminopeptidase